MTTMPAAFSLAHLPTASLQALWAQLHDLPPTTRVLELHLALEAHRSVLEPLLGQPAWLVCTIVEAALAERGRFEATVPSPETPVRIEYRPLPASQSRIELVWSGSTAPRSCARSTRESIEDLLSTAERDVFVAGYSFDHASDLFQPLVARATHFAQLGRPLPRVRVVLDCSRKPAHAYPDREALARAVRDDFWHGCWTPCAIQPELRYLGASADRTSDGFAPVSMHAKCIIIDRQVALVGSANFSPIAGAIATSRSGPSSASITSCKRWWPNGKRSGPDSRCSMSGRPLACVGRSSNGAAYST